MINLANFTCDLVLQFCKHNHVTRGLIKSSVKRSQEIYEITSYFIFYCSSSWQSLLNDIGIFVGIYDRELKEEEENSLIKNVYIHVINF
jgi:hypothetical protein